MAPRTAPSPLMLLLCVALLSSGLLGALRSAQGDVGRDVIAALKKGLRSDAPELKRQAILDVGRLRSHLSSKQARRAALLLRGAFDEELDQEARRLMVRALGRLETATAWVPVILASFGDRDPAIQKAARLEVLGGGPGFLEVVSKLLREDEDPTFQAELLLLLGDRRNVDAVPLLIANLGAKAPRVVAAAAEALEAITGQAFGYAPEPWTKWHAIWAKTSAARARAEGHKTVEAGERSVGEEPPPHVTRSLVPRFFGLPLHAKDLVFVVDISGSVGSGGLERIRRELVRAVELLGSDVHVSALFFSDEVRMWKPDMVAATPKHKGELAYFLRGLAPGKRTDVFTPLNAGLQIVRRRVAAKEAAGEPFRTPVTMIVLSDGRDNMAKTPPAIVQDKLERLDLAQAAVHALVLGNEDSRLLHRLAARGGGHYRRVK